MAALDPGTEARRERLKQILKQYLDKGISQLEVARRAGVPPQYLSDVKRGRRALAELLARRLAEKLGFNYRWLMEGRYAKPCARPGVAGLLLPILDEPCAGEPREHPAWDGSIVEITGPAAVLATRARRPYILRAPFDDHCGRFLEGALLLVQQSLDADRKIATGRCGNTGLLAERDSTGNWRGLEDGRLLGTDFQQHGAVLGVVWAPL